MFKGSRLTRINLVLSIVLILVLLLSFWDSSYLEGIEAFAAGSPLTAFLLILSLFILSALIPFLPSIPFYAMSGRVLQGRFLAFGVSFIGIVFFHVISYFVGAHSVKSKKSEHSILVKYRQAKKALYDAVGRTVRSDRFHTLFLLALSPFPQKTLGRICGSVHIPFGIFLMASLVGSLPSLISITMLGKSLNDPSSPFFYFSVILTVTVTVFSALIFHKSNLDKENSDEKSN